MIPKKSAQELGDLYHQLDQIDESRKSILFFIDEQRERLTKLQGKRADLLAKISELGGEVEDQPKPPAYFTAERTGHPRAADHRWAIIHDPTPGGRRLEDGSRSFSLRFPVLLLTEYVAEPEKVAGSVAESLNKARALEDAQKR